MAETSGSSTRVAVIGIGSAGLAQLKQTQDAFRRAGKELELVGFEMRDEVGGLWNYVANCKPFIRRHDTEGERTWMYPQKGEDPTPFYENLRATLPGDLMAFRELPFPKDAPEIPWGHQLQEYLVSYADTFDLRRYIRFRTRVDRLYHSPQTSTSTRSSLNTGERQRKWTLHSSNLDTGEARVEGYDYVAVCNGHYSDPWIPNVPGLSTFPGRIQHSREYRRPSEYVGQRVLVLGSGNSGSDIVRHLASLNLEHYQPTGALKNRAAPPDKGSQGFTTVYHSVTGANRAGYNSATDAWAPYIRTVGLVSHVDPATGDIQLVDGTKLEGIDTIIFATGYNNCLPFAKTTDEPWRSISVLDGVITQEERAGGGDLSEVGGLRGLHMQGLDELLLFLDNDRTIAFPGLPYQIVPFPFSELQSRVASLLWAGLLPSFPAHPAPPPNPAVAAVYPTPPATPPAPTEPPGPDVPPAKSNPNPNTGRISETVRKELIFAPPYEWVYTRYCMDLMREADGKDEAVQGYWKEVEQWRVERRKDTGLRKRSLGY